MWRFALVVGIIGCKPPAVVAEPVSVAETLPVVVPMTATTSTSADRDHDGIVDARDGCPGVAEDVDQFEDEDGCVDRDNDKDGVVDAFEWKDGRWTNCDFKMQGDELVDCRDRPEDRDGVEDEDGCPDVMCFDHCQLKLGRVHHDARGAFIGDVTAEFDSVAKVLQTTPTLRVHVQAHVERRRNAAVARKASQQLGELAAAELVRRGVTPERLEVLPYGHEMPIADEKLPSGREANRRIDFMVTGLDPCSCRPFVADRMRSETCV